MYDHINNIHTQEHKKSGKLVFLDVEIIKKGSKILTKWHLKSTNTGTYLHKSSYSPTSHKIAAMRSLIYRAYSICSSEMLFNECYSTIESIFINNGYHYSYIEKIKRKTIENYIKNQQKSQQTPQTNADTKNTKYITLTYIKENENKIRKVAKLIEDTIGKDKIQIRTAYKTKKTQSFFSNKDKIPTDIRSNIVYSYNCDQCPGLQYIKESVRHFSTPKNEHINGDSNPTEVTTHIHTAKEENFYMFSNRNIQ